jgi:hypothetical protein
LKIKRIGLEDSLRIRNVDDRKLDTENPPVEFRSSLQLETAQTLFDYLSSEQLTTFGILIHDKISRWD